MLPFLEKTVFFLYPVVLVLVLFVLSVALQFNITNFVMEVYFGMPQF